MKICSILLLLFLLTTIHAGAQVNRDGVIYRGKQKFLDCMDLSVGYIYDHKYERFTLSSSVNNIISDRFGIFGMLEIYPPAPAFVFGPTITIYDFAYIYAGMDVFTSRGYFRRGGFTHARKDLGICVYPFKWGVIKICHSFHADSRVEIGLRIPLEREDRFIRTVRRR